MRHQPPPEGGGSMSRPVVAWPLAVVVGLALGSLAVLADHLPLKVARVVILVASTGLAWGAAAVLLGAMSRRPWQAAVAGVLVLLTAVVTYYWLISVSGSRQSSADALTGAATAWGLAALLGGPVAGACGWYARHASGWSRAAAWGGLSGLLLSQAVYLVARDREERSRAASSRCSWASWWRRRARCCSTARAVARIASSPCWR